MRFRRTLPFGDYSVDRWEKAGALGFGSGTSVYDSSLVLGEVQVGERTWIGPGTILDGSGGLQIGDNCSIAAGVQIYSHDTVQWAITGGKAAYEYAPTRIGNNCYIGPNAVIAMGTTIGDGAVIGAMSFVNMDVPSGSKVGGCPARILGEPRQLALVKRGLERPTSTGCDRDRTQGSQFSLRHSPTNDALA